MENKVPSWPIFWAAFSSYFTLAFSFCSCLNFSLQRTLWTWLAFSQFDWLQDTFCKCHSGCVWCVNLTINQETNEEKVLEISIAFFWSQSLPSLKTGWCWQVREWAQEDCQFLRLAGTLLSSFQTYSNYPHPHVWWPVVALPRRESPLNREGPHSDRPLSADIVFLWAHCWVPLLCVTSYSTFISIMKLKDCISITPSILHIAVKAHIDALENESCC